MGDWKILDLKDSLYSDLEVGVENRQFGTACQELDKFIELFLVVALQNLPQPLYDNRGFGVALDVFYMSS